MATKQKVLLIIGAVVLVIALCGYLITQVLFPKTEPAEPEVTVATVPETPKPEPETIPEPEPEPEPKGPDLAEEDGVTYLTLEGVRMLLVNKVYPIPADFGGENPEARAALDEMIAAAAKDGINLFLVSGYRSYDTQEAIYNRYVSKYGQEYTDRISARPGHSEHQAGLSFDLNSLEQEFENTPECRWLQENCADFGFILRYAKESEWATGYTYEPWHYRYIKDTALAKKLMESGISLEEYAGLITEKGQSGYRN